MELESGTRMAVKPGCFAIRRDQNLSMNQQLLRVRLQKQPDAFPEGVPLPLAFACYATKVFCPSWYWSRGPGWLSCQGVLQSDETKIPASPNQQLFESAHSHLASLFRSYRQLKSTLNMNGFLFICRSTPLFV